MGWRGCISAAEPRMGSKRGLPRWMQIGGRAPSANRGAESQRRLPPHRRAKAAGRSAALPLGARGLCALASSLAGRARPLLLRPSSQRGCRRPPPPPSRPPSRRRDPGEGAPLGMEGESTTALLPGFLFGALAFHHLSTDSDSVRKAPPALRFGELSVPAPTPQIAVRGPVAARVEPGSPRGFFGRSNRGPDAKKGTGHLSNRERARVFFGWRGLVSVSFRLEPDGAAPDTPPAFPQSVVPR